MVEATARAVLLLLSKQLQGDFDIKENLFPLESTGNIRTLFCLNGSFPHVSICGAFRRTHYSNAKHSIERNGFDVIFKAEIPCGNSDRISGLVFCHEHVQAFRFGARAGFHLDRNDVAALFSTKSSSAVPSLVQ